MSAYRFYQETEIRCGRRRRFTLYSSAAAYPHAEGVFNFAGHGYEAYIAVSFRCLYEVFAAACADKLTLVIYAMFIKVNVRYCQSEEFRDTHSRIKKDKYSVIVAAVMVIVSDKIKIVIHLLLCHGFSRLTVVFDDGRQFKSE